MTPEDAKNLHRELCARWKGKFTPSDLNYWARELTGWGINEIVDALTRHRNSSKFVPKVGEIKALLPRRLDAPRGNPAAAESFAQILRRQNRQYEGRSDAEVILRYYRSLWVCYGTKAKNPESSRRQFTSGTVTGLCACGMAIAEAERAAAFIFDPPDAFRLLLDELRHGATRDPFASEAGIEHQFT